MKTIPQYTIRNMPESADRYLRRRAKESGKSINQIIIDIVSEEAGLTKNGKAKNLLESLSWLLGSGMDQETIAALERMDREQKTLAAREMAKLDEVSRL